MANGGWGPPPGGFGPPPGMPPGWQPERQQLDGGIPWESPNGGLFLRWWQTLGATLKGRPFFATVAQSDDAMSAVTFHTMTWMVMGLVSGLFYSFVFGIFGAGALGPLYSMGYGLPFSGGLFAIASSILFGSTLCGAFFGFVEPWVVGGLHHLVLSLVGGIPPGRTYAHTVRAHAYASGGAAVFSAIPYVGALVTFVLSIKNHLEAYDEMHRCGGKALLAYFSPVLFCCCGCCSLFTLFSSLVPLGRFHF